MNSGYLNAVLDALLGLLALLIAIIGWFARQMLRDLEQKIIGLEGKVEAQIETERTEINILRHVNRKRHQMIVVTLMSLQTELHPEKAEHIRRVMSRLMDDGKDDSP